MVNCVLMVAYHYPPIRVSSGVQRSLAFSRYLQENGWDSIVLTAHPRAYANVSDDQMNDIPENVLVERAFALDTSKHLSIRGRYLDVMALPDRWISWWFGGVWSGLRLIRKYRPKLIWSTYPIATAHLIGLALHKLTGLPWVADFRDSMVDDTYPYRMRQRRIFFSIEQQVVKHSKLVVFTTPGAIRMYRERYPDLPRDKWRLLPNGYDEEIFSEIEKTLVSPKQLKGRMESTPMVLLHSGVIYPSERDPKPFFQALSELKQEQLIDKNRLNIVLRATGHDDQYRPLLEQLAIDDIVRLEPGVSYRKALEEMMMADGLLIFQGATCNHQVPAKVYEYFRAGRPVFALTDQTGDTAATLVDAGFSDIAPLDDVNAIREKLLEFMDKLESGKAVVANDEAVLKYSRQSASEMLANWFNIITDNKLC